MENKGKKKVSEELNENIKEKVKDIKDDLKEKADDIKEDLTDKTKEFKKDLNKKTKELKKELKEKTEDLKEKTEEILNDVKNSSNKFDKKDIESNKAMAALAYIVAPIPYFVEDKSKWVRYHAIQGMNLFIIYIILCLTVSIINSVFLWPFPFLKSIVRAALYAFMVIYSVIGIVNVCNGEAKELPLVNKFKIIKE